MVMVGGRSLIGVAMSMMGIIMSVVVLMTNRFVGVGMGVLIPKKNHNAL
jgi:hypothetical protein